MVYDHRKIENKWRKVWEEQKVYQPFGLRPQGKPAKPKFYNLMMFPYPSAEGLHVGNMYAFTGVDVYGRFKRMQGYDIFEPIGLDGFGIHSENYAIKEGRHPAEQAKISEKHFYDQLGKIGNGFAWDNRLETYDPDYYKWTQWLFVKMYQKGLAYRGKAKVNWCPSCKTVLADEQVEAGVCERCKTEVVKKDMEQWFFKITAYADRLLEGLDKIDWPKKIKIAQRNWIGKKAGINITYEVVDSQETITCFTTTPVNFGATFIVLAPEHPLVKKIELKQVKEYVDKSLKETQQQRMAGEKHKTGVFTGLYALNHVTGEKIPIWVADFVLMDVGTGAVQGCPGHDRRDFEFARKFGIPIKRVVVGPDGDKSDITREDQVIESGMPGKMVNSDFLDGMEFAEAMQATMDHFEKKGWGKRVYHYHLRDWLISRQRYWGPPIPMIKCEECGWQPVPEEDLPVILPPLEDFEPGDGMSPLERAGKGFFEVECPNCGKKAKRETDVSDTFLDSAWYYLRYPSVGVQNAKLKMQNLPWDPEITRTWLPVDAYIGGAEHAVLHLMYSRFVWMFLRDYGYLEVDRDGPCQGEEPFPFLFSHGLIIKDGAKMSKSRGNVVNPDEYIDRYGADALRMYLMFVGPYSQGGDFRDTGMVGMYRFLERVWRLFQAPLKVTPLKVKRKLHQTIKKVTQDMAKFKFNTAIAALMELTNLWQSQRSIKAAKHKSVISREDAIKFVKLLAPLAPYIAEELYQSLRKHEIRSPSAPSSGSRDTKFESIHTQPWPEYDQEAIKEDEVTIMVQVNGKVRASFATKQQITNSKLQIVKLAQKNDKVAKYLEGKRIKNVVWVPQKLVNFVIE